MLKRLQHSSLNLLVLTASLVVFLVSFFVLQGMVRTRTPAATTIWTAVRDLQIGETIRAADLAEKNIFIDETTPLYFTGPEAEQLLGAYTALPIRAGQPIPRANLIAAASAGDRYSALLSQFPKHSLFPLPLDGTNITAPPIEVFLPGDLIGITVVLGSRPQHPATEAPGSFSFTLPGPASTALPAAVPLPTGTPDETFARGFPPLAKDIFPEGVLVAGVQGLPQPANPDEPAPAFNAFQQPPMLILLLADNSRERLSLAIQQGDRLFITLLNHTDHAQSTKGFSYWDFEAWFQADRAEEELP